MFMPRQLIRAASCRERGKKLELAASKAKRRKREGERFVSLFMADISAELPLNLFARRGQGKAGRHRDEMG